MDEEENRMNWKTCSHPISDVYDWNESGRLELQPDFQRNEVWTRAAQIMLIDTIIKNIPMPKIYMKSYIKDQRTYRVVIDGQQRLTAILAFINNEFPLVSPYEGDFKNSYYRDLPSEMQDNIIGYLIDMNELFNPTDDEVRDLYARVNKYTVQLNKQELRKADYAGDFIKLAEEISVNDFFDDIKIFTPYQRRRMLDVEYIEELLSILLEGIQDKKEQLDSLCEKYTVMGEKYVEIQNMFTNIIYDFKKIFSEEFPMSKTRFNQKSDFYSLFACVYNLKSAGKTLDEDKIPQLRKQLETLTQKIGPQAEEEPYREYAMRCLSDANSKNSRIWRVDYMYDYFEKAYKN